MAHLIYAQRAFLDHERLTDFLRESEPAAALATAGLIAEAVDVLRHHPLIGRPADSGLRELVISRGKSGYLALYRFRPEADAVVVLGIRHQREGGYPAIEPRM